MKTVNIYNQTFLGLDETEFKWSFTFAPHIVKQNQNNKWKITVINASCYLDTVAVAETFLFWSSDLGQGKQSSQVASNFQVETDMLLASLGNYVDGNDLCLSQSPAPMIFMVNDLAKSPFNVYYTKMSSNNLTPSTDGIQMSFTLRMEEVEC